MRQARSRDQVDDTPSEVRWDPMTGERTTDAKGRPSQVKPVEYAQGFGLTNSSSPVPQLKGPAAASASLSGRFRRLAQAAKDEFGPSSRLPWKGASGRTALMDPVHDDKALAPLEVPERSNRAVSSSSAAPRPDLLTSATLSGTNLAHDTGERETTPSSQLARSHVAATSQGRRNDSSYPSPPSSGNSATKRLSAIDTLPSQSPVGPPAESDPFGDKPLIKRKSTPSQAKAQPRPPSRFGVSAYATDATDTPRQSSDEHPPSMPTPPSPPTRLVNRLGMKVNHEDPSVSFPFAPQTARDRRAALDGPLGNTAVNRARMPVERPTSSASSINKMLPPAPPEISADQAQDRVAMLNAQLSALGNRRINLTRSIKQMTELMPMDNLMASREVLLKRDMEKRKVAALKNELAEVQREEYDLGLKLHRAYKRMDRDAVWEPTTLWVRRVAGP